jgi:hypothetical protein
MAFGVPKKFIMMKVARTRLIFSMALIFNLAALSWKRPSSTRVRIQDWALL